MTLLLAAATGSQRPRVSSAPKSVSSSGGDAIELAALAGLVLDPWQEHVLQTTLGERADGKWSALEVGLIVPRQNGKGSVLEARELAGLFLFDERTIIHSAHEMKTAVEAFIRIRDLCRNTPELDEQVRAYYQSNEKTAIELKNGARLRFMARSDGSGRGFTGDVIILDEAYNLPQATLQAIFSTMSAKSITGNPQLWYTSSAGMESSDVLAGVRERGIRGDKRLAYLEWSAPDDADLDDRSAWAVANPGLGIRISEEFVEAERGALDDPGFARERLGIWHDPSKGVVFDPLLWASLADQDAERPTPVAFALDVPPDRSTASIAVVGERGDGHLQAELIRSKSEVGTSWVPARMAELVAEWGPVAVVLDASGPAGSLLAPLAEIGVDVIPIPRAGMTQACGMFFDAVTEKSLHHGNDPRLNAALMAARQRGHLDTWVWARKNLTDISPLVAVTLALYGLKSKQPPPPKKPSAAFAF